MPPPIGEWSIVMTVSVSVRLSVCPRAYLRNYMSDLHQIFGHVTYVCGSPCLVTLRYVMYFRFVDDVMFVHNGQE